MAKSKQIIYYLTIIFLFWSCANQLPPTGGEVDKIPPEVIDTYPADGTINFSDNYIEITFSEYVDKRSVKEAIFISPQIEGEIDYTWTGTSLELEFEDNLKQNTTYTVTVGASVKDINNNNPMEAPFTFLFSTGAKIDSGKISGRIYSQNPLGTYVFAYKSVPDTVDLLTDKPDYISQVGTSGDFIFKGLSETKYKLIAVVDRFGNKIYNVEEDSYGIPYKDIDLTATKEIDNVDFMITREDTTSPNLISAIMTDAIHVLMEFSEPVDSSIFTKDNFYAYDSTTSKSIPSANVFKGNAKALQFYVTLQDTLNQNNSNYFIINKLYDRSSNVSMNQTIELNVNDLPDTLKPQLLRVETNGDGKLDLEKTRIKLFFNDGISIIDSGQAVSLFDEDSNKIEVVFHKEDAAQLNVLPKSKIKSNKNYRIEIDLNYFSDAAGNKGDTVISKNFFSINELDYTGISGSVKYDGDYPVEVILNKLNTDLSFSQKISESNKFEFDRLTPGNYSIFAFEDRNSNGKYDHGSVQPYSLSEKFSYYPDTLKLKARWPVGDVIIDLNK